MSLPRSQWQIERDVETMRERMHSERHVAIAGDWHNDTTWIMNVFARVKSAIPPLHTILHLGDLEIGNDKYAKARLNFIDERCRGTGVERVLVTPGNHDNWDRLEQRREWGRRMPTPLSDHVWALPPGFRFDLGGRHFLSFGGAASVQDVLVAGSNYWPGEVRPVQEFEEAAASGHADVMLTHEAVNAGLPRVDQRTSGSGGQHLLPDRRRASIRSRQLVTDLWNEVSPELLFHGHMHVRDQLQLPDGRRVYSLADNREKVGNMGLLDLTTLGWTWH